MCHWTKLADFMVNPWPWKNGKKSGQVWQWKSHRHQGGWALCTQQSLEDITYWRARQCSWVCSIAWKEKMLDAKISCLGWSVPLLQLGRVLSAHNHQQKIKTFNWFITAHIRAYYCCASQADYESCPPGLCTYMYRCNWLSTWRVLYYFADCLLLIV